MNGGDSPRTTNKKRPVSQAPPSTAHRPGIPQGARCARSSGDGRLHYTREVDTRELGTGTNDVSPRSAWKLDTALVRPCDPRSVQDLGEGPAVHGDGLTDLVCQVETENLDPDQFQDGYALLTASTYDGQPIQGRDEIIIVPQE
jgi:hypothetical protein